MYNCREREREDTALGLTQRGRSKPFGRALLSAGAICTPLVTMHLAAFSGLLGVIQPNAAEGMPSAAAGTRGQGLCRFGVR